MIESVHLEWRFGTLEMPAADRYFRAAIEATGEYCPSELELYQALLSPGDVAIDVGANIGIFSIGMALAVGPKGRVLAFEPQPPIFAMLQRNIAAHRLEQIEPHRSIVSDHDGAGKFVDIRSVPAGRQLNFGGIGRDTRIISDHGDVVPTPICSLDALRLDRCALIKVDVEGGEEAVLRGFTETLQRCRPMLSIECDRPNATSPWVDTLLAANYRLWRFRGHLVRHPNPKGAAIDDVPNPVSIMVVAIPEERAGVLDRVDRSTLRAVASRAELEALSRNIVVM